jgi:HAD superfamily 5'-nucleotidase-like hydrolase
MSWAPAHAVPDATATATLASELKAAEREVPEIPRTRRIYVNRSLALDHIELVGFDMDYTLAVYNQAKLEELSMRATLEKLCTVKGYPEEIRALPYDSTLAVRGLVIDRLNGNVFKPDRYGAPGRARHGLTSLERTKIDDLYQRERMRLSNRRYAWIDSLFALPEAVLYANLVQFFDGLGGKKPDYARLWDDIRESIDLAHRDGSMKTIVKADIGSYIERDPHLAEALHKLRSSGKRLFLLTNSAWDYTQPVMSYLLDDALSAYPSWRSYFDIIIVSAAKPEFFTEERPFVELGSDGEPLAKPRGSSFVRGRIYAGGNLKDFEVRTQVRGDGVLFVGDHIYGDMLRPRKATNWRTAMILQELEHEILTTDQVATKLAELDKLDERLMQLDAALTDKQQTVRMLEKHEEDLGADTASAHKRRKIKDAIEALRGELRQTAAQHRALERETDLAFNPHWGPIFREGNEISKFGEQVEAYACVYTSRVSNFRHYSPMHLFRSPRDRMPHERL